jgi:hypothetical protein
MVMVSNNVAILGRKALLDADGGSAAMTPRISGRGSRQRGQSQSKRRNAFFHNIPPYVFIPFSIRCGSENSLRVKNFPTPVTSLKNKNFNN